MQEAKLLRCRVSYKDEKLLGATLIDKNKGCSSSVMDGVPVNISLDAHAYLPGTDAINVDWRAMLAADKLTEKQLKQAEKIR
eukprot:1158610-Pelagomonas_calceolata.AAC.4